MDAGLGLYGPCHAWHNLYKGFYHDLFQLAVHLKEEGPDALCLMPCAGDLDMVGFSVNGYLELAGSKMRQLLRGLGLFFRLKIKRLRFELARIPLLKKLQRNVREKGV